MLATRQCGKPPPRSRLLSGPSDQTLESVFSLSVPARRTLLLESRRARMRDFVLCLVVVVLSRESGLGVGNGLLYLSLMGRRKGIYDTMEKELDDLDVLFCSKSY